MSSSELSVKELKRKLTELHVDFSHCVEKDDLIKLLAEMNDRKSKVLDGPNQFHIDQHQRLLAQQQELQKEGAGIFSSASNWYGMLVDMIIRPPRALYRRDMLGPDFFQLPNGKACVREDFTVEVVMEGDKSEGSSKSGAESEDPASSSSRHLQVSLFRPAVLSSSEPLPAVVYCHGNGGCRLEAVEMAPSLLMVDVLLVCFDFSGCGLSDGEYVTLGAEETDDLTAVMRHLRKERSDLVGPISIYGRSMGAVTALFYSLKVLDRRRELMTSASDVSESTSSIAASSSSSSPSSSASAAAAAKKINDSLLPEPISLVLDSPFSALTEVCHDMASLFTPVRLPRFAVAAGLRIVRSSIQSRAGFDIYSLNPLSRVHELTSTPALFAHGKDDDFVYKENSERLYEKYGCPDKHIILLPGHDHNSSRPESFELAATRFLLERFQLPISAALSEATDKYFKRGLNAYKGKRRKEESKEKNTK